MKGAEEQKEVEHRVLCVSPTGQVISPALDYEGLQQISLWAQKMTHLSEKDRAGRVKRTELAGKGEVMAGSCRPRL